MDEIWNAPALAAFHTKALFFADNDAFGASNICECDKSIAAAIGAEVLIIWLLDGCLHGLESAFGVSGI